MAPFDNRTPQAPHQTNRGWAGVWWRADGLSAHASFMFEVKQTHLCGHRQVLSWTVGLLDDRHGSSRDQCHADTPMTGSGRV